MYPLGQPWYLEMQYLELNPVFLKKWQRLQKLRKPELSSHGLVQPLSIAIFHMFPYQNDDVYRFLGGTTIYAQTEYLTGPTPEPVVMQCIFN